MLTAFHVLRLFKCTFGMILLFMLASACATTPAQPAVGVTFTVPVPVEAFSPTAALQVGIWNARQLEQLDRQAECVVSVDVQTQVETVHCPEGVQYQQIKPEEFVFPVQSIDQRIQLTSQSVKIGEKYQIVLRGLSRDDCNLASAMAEGTATTSTITLGNLDWMTT